MLLDSSGVSNARQRQSQQQRAANKLKLSENQVKTLMRSRQMLNKHYMEMLAKIVPERWHIIADYLPPRWYWKIALFVTGMLPPFRVMDWIFTRDVKPIFWPCYLSVLMAPICLVGDILRMIFVAIPNKLHEALVKMGTFGRVTQIDDYNYRLRIYRWLTLKYECQWDWRTSRPIVKVELNQGDK